MKNIQDIEAPQFVSTSSLFEKGGLLEPKDEWDKLSMAAKAEMMRVAVNHGIYDLQTIRQKYNEFAEGGSKEEEEEDTIVPFEQKTEVVITPDAEYNQYLNTLPDNQRFTPNDKYDSYLYWKLNGRPRNFREAVQRGMFTFDHSDNAYHANSIAFDDNTGIGYFMKPKDHNTVGYELDWFNKGLVTEEGGHQRPETPEEKAESDIFRHRYTLMTDPDRPNYYRYHPVEYASGGGIHIKPSHRGRLTELKKRTGKTEAELYNDGNPAHKKMVVFARNARRWKHSDGGHLISEAINQNENLYGFGDWLNNIVNEGKQFIKKIDFTKSPAQHIIELFSGTEEPKEQQTKKQTVTYRNRPAVRTLVKTKDNNIIMTLPTRQRNNSSKTQEQSQKIEGQMNIETYRHQQKSGGSNPAFDIPFIPEKAIILNGSTTSTNVLDSLAKYAGVHNRDPKLSEHPIMHSSKYKTPRIINKNEMLGLAAQETKNGAIPYFNFVDGDAEYNRALANSNYFTSYGFIPADNIVRNFHYNNTNVNRNTPPLLDAFRYFAQGDYNRGNKNHTSDVNNTGAKLWNNPKVKEWWEKSGKYWYNNGHGPQKEKDEEQKKQNLQLKYYEKNEPRIIP